MTFRNRFLLPIFCLLSFAASAFGEDWGFTAEERREERNAGSLTAEEGIVIDVKGGTPPASPAGQNAHTDSPATDHGTQDNAKEKASIPEPGTENRDSCPADAQAASAPTDKTKEPAATSETVDPAQAATPAPAAPAPAATQPPTEMPQATPSPSGAPDNAVKADEDSAAPATPDKSLGGNRDGAPLQGGAKAFPDKLVRELKGGRQATAPGFSPEPETASDMNQAGQSEKTSDAQAPEAGKAKDKPEDKATDKATSPAADRAKDKTEENAEDGTASKAANKPADVTPEAATATSPEEKRKPAPKRRRRKQWEEPAEWEPDEPSPRAKPAKTEEKTEESKPEKAAETDAGKTPKASAETAEETDAPESLVEANPPSGLSLLKSKTALCSISHETGEFELFLGGGTLEGLRIFVNDTSVLENASYASALFPGLKKQAVTAEKSVGGLKVAVRFRFAEDAWLAISISVVNTGTEPFPVSDLRFTDLPLSALLADCPPGTVRLFTDTDAPGSYPSSRAITEGEPLSGSGFGVIHRPGQDAAWFLGWPYPYARPYRLTADGSAARLQARLDLSANPQVIQPKATVVFDEFFIGGTASLLDGLRDWGRFCARSSGRTPLPHRDIVTLGAGSGRTMTAADILAAGQETAAWRGSSGFLRSGTPYISHLLLAEGWKREGTNASFTAALSDPEKPWIAPLNEFGISPGVWLEPLRTVNPPAGASAGTVANPTPTEVASWPDRPGDPLHPDTVLRACEHIKSLREAGIQCFRTRGLLSDPSLPADTVTDFPKREKNLTSLRAAYAAFREAMGKDVLWISDEPLTAVTAGLVDTHVLTPDAPRTWEDVRDKVVRRNAGRFWQHGNVATLCQADLALSGTELAKRNEDGTLPPEARTWCAYLVIAGGPILWADDYAKTAPEIRALVMRTLEYAGGEAGVPLDLGTEELPSRWIRRDGKTTYIALFNWTEEPRTVSLDYRQVRELSKLTSLSDLFTGQACPVEQGVLSVTLPPRQSFSAVLAP